MSDGVRTRGIYEKGCLLLRDLPHPQRWGVSQVGAAQQAKIPLVEILGGCVEWVVRIGFEWQEHHLSVKHFSVEDHLELRALLFVLHCVLIMDIVLSSSQNDGLCKGVGDSEVLSLNLSWETLTQYKILRVIKVHVRWSPKPVWRSYLRDDFCTDDFYEKGCASLKKFVPVILAIGDFCANFTNNSLLTLHRPELLHTVGDTLRCVYLHPIHLRSGWRQFQKVCCPCSLPVAVSVPIASEFFVGNVFPDLLHLPVSNSEHCTGDVSEMVGRGATPEACWSQTSPVVSSTNTETVLPMTWEDETTWQGRCGRVSPCSFLLAWPPCTYLWTILSLSLSQYFLQISEKRRDQS